MTGIILTDENEICWKIRMTKDMNLAEILEGIEKQFYPKRSYKTGRKNA